MFQKFLEKRGMVFRVKQRGQKEKNINSEKNRNGFWILFQVFLDSGSRIKSGKAVAIVNPPKIWDTLTDWGKLRKNKPRENKDAVLSPSTSRSFNLSSPSS